MEAESNKHETEAQEAIVGNFTESLSVLNQSIDLYFSSSWSQVASRSVWNLC